ncbi:MAG: hypothetical protein QXP36_03770 [Conexivisphaerales archaeon]
MSVDKKIEEMKMNELENMIERVIDCVLTKGCIGDRVRIDTFIIREELRKENIKAVIYNPYSKLYSVIRVNDNAIVLNVLTETEFKHLVLRLMSDIRGLQL